MTFIGDGPVSPQPKSQHSSSVRGQEALHQCVRRAVRRYLKDMGDHEPDGLYRLVMDQIEKPLIEEVLRWAGGNQCRTAAALGISRGTLRKRINGHKIGQ